MINFKIPTEEDIDRLGYTDGSIIRVRDIKNSTVGILSKNHYNEWIFIGKEGNVETYPTVAEALIENISEGHLDIIKISYL